MGRQAHRFVAKASRLEPFHAFCGGLCTGHSRRSPGFQLQPRQQWRQRRSEFGKWRIHIQFSITTPPWTIIMPLASTFTIGDSVWCMVLADWVIVIPVRVMPF